MSPLRKQAGFARTLRMSPLTDLDRDMPPTKQSEAGTLFVKDVVIIDGQMDLLQEVLEHRFEHQQISGTKIVFLTTPSTYAADVQTCQSMFNWLKLQYERKLSPGSTASTPWSLAAEPLSMSSYGHSTILPNIVFCSKPMGPRKILLAIRMALTKSSVEMEAITQEGSNPVRLERLPRRRKRIYLELLTFLSTNIRIKASYPGCPNLATSAASETLQFENIRTGAEPQKLRIRTAVENVPTEPIHPLRVFESTKPEFFQDTPKTQKPIPIDDLKVLIVEGTW
jgi:hypothetical protein